MKEDLNKKIEALETAIETIQEALFELKAKQREIEAENAKQHVRTEKKEYIETVMEEKQKEEVVTIKEPVQERGVKQVDIAAFKREPFNIIKFCHLGIYISCIIWIFITCPGFG